MENRISPGALIMWIIIALIVGGLIGYYLPRETYAPGSNILYDDADNGAENVVPVTVAREGEYVCLPHRNQEGPTTQECAFGLETSDGVYYALDVSAVTFPDTIVTGDNIRITGTVASGVDADTLMERYAIIGVIRVIGMEEI